MAEEVWAQAASFAIALLVGGCGGATRADDDGNALDGDTNVIDAWATDASSSTGDGPENDAVSKVDASDASFENCTPDPGILACCGEHACRGHCEGESCWCGMLAGGCPPPLACCAGYCAPEGNCT